MKIKTPYLLSLAVLAAALPSAAFADAGNWYGLVGAGASSYGNSSNDENSLVSGLAQEGITATANVDDNATGWTLGVGYKFNRYVAVELGYVDFGSANATVNVTQPQVFSLSESVEAKGESLDVVGFLPFSERFSLFGKFGLFNYNLDDTLSAPIPVTNPSASGSTYDIGIGADISLSRRFSLRAGLTQYHGVGDENTTGKSNIGFAYGELVVNF